MKIDLKAMVINIEEEHEDVTIEEVAEELPEFQPRYIAYRCGAARLISLSASFYVCVLTSLCVCVYMMIGVATAMSTKTEG